MLRTLLGAALLATTATAATAQEDYSTILSGGAALGSQSHSLVAGAQRVSFTVPVAQEEGPRFGVLLQPSPPDGGLAALTFHTPEQGLIEAVHLSTAMIPMEGTAQDRQEAFRTLLRDTAVPALQGKLSDLQVETTRNMRLGGFDAVELTGTASHPTHGALRWRLMGILNPSGPDSLYTLSQVATAALPVTGPENFGQSLSGRLLDSLRFD